MKKESKILNENLKTFLEEAGRNQELKAKLAALTGGTSPRKRPSKSQKSTALL